MSKFKAKLFLNDKKICVLVISKSLHCFSSTKNSFYCQSIDIDQLQKRLETKAMRNRNNEMVACHGAGERIRLICLFCQIDRSSLDLSIFAKLIPKHHLSREENIISTKCLLIGLPRWIVSFLFCFKSLLYFIK